MEQAGDHGLAHWGRGQPSNRRIPDKVKAMMLQLYEKRYRDFGPTLAAEKLTERQGLTLSDETLRWWLRARGISHFMRRKRPHRAWRERKAQGGELVQLDGSHHDWFKGRGPRCVLMAYIDDASSQVCARFYTYEGTIPALDSFTRDVTRYGIPLAVYADKHTTDQSPPHGGRAVGRGQAHESVWAGAGRAGSRADPGPLPPRRRGGWSGALKPFKIG